MTDSACLRALQIAEIVRMICDQARVTWSSSQTTLVSLARTSKIFSDPALDALWYEQHSLVPLAKCMPDTLWEEQGRKKRNIVIHLRRPITSEDMSRFLFYSVRVRQLEMRNLSTYGAVHHDFLRALDMASPVQGCMPRLSIFSWSPTKKDPLSIMHHFLGSQTRKIVIELGDETAGLSILPYIKSSCPLVTTFDLYLDTDPQSVSPRSISDAVCGWPHLVDLSIPNLDKAGFTHISRLPFLANLSLYSAKDTASLHLPDFLAGRTFPVLNKLSISCETARFCAGVIRVISSRHFQSLSITQMTNWTTAAWQELHTTIRDCLDHTALNAIEVEAKGVRRPSDTAPYVLSSDAVRHLLAFKNMTDVTYQVYPCVDANDDFLEEMALAWPKIERLYLGSEVLHMQPPQATLKCLIAFARHCSELSSLGVRMNASLVPTFTQVRGHRISHSLNSLEVGTSPIDPGVDTPAAAFISNLFPELEYLFTFSSGNFNVTLPEPLSRHETTWSRVSDMIPVFHSVRQEEEEFWTEELGNEEESEEEEEGSSTLDENDVASNL
ncbi:hypothetical protein DFH06DRAFT_715021 [Mycena polygramma]|nr:hypothetical protein DFH06DRAFT_715021 [Mycena polygramma]